MPVVRSHNQAVKTAYFAALDGITYDGVAVPRYADQAADSPPPLYITFTVINNTEDSPKTTPFVDCSVLVSIFSSAVKYHNTLAIDYVADEVLQRITAGITLNDFQNITVDVVNDNQENLRSAGGALISADRLITFRHKIMQ